MKRPTMRRRPLPPTLRAMSFCSRLTTPAACTAQDWPALRRLAHSLATVLLTLSHPAQSVRARQPENAAVQPAPEACLEHWRLLRAFLLQI